MHVLIHSCILVSWMYTVSVEAQGCKIVDFNPENREAFTTHNLKPEYAVGSAVRVHCQTGYEGFYKMKCGEDGTWSSQNAECKRKQCGHPGESPNADFDLTASSKDFAFGSEVLYRCKPGYVMISRSPVRTCMSQGWSNTLPVCEALKCPPLQVDGNMHAYGEQDEATSGTVVTFKCKTSNMIVDGPGNIDCNDQGEWSGQVPTCKILKCLAPKIDNGLVRNNRGEYDENDFLEYECNSSYKKFDTNMIPRCGQMRNAPQWNPDPRCEEIKCELTTSDRGTYTPPGQTYFSIGDQLKVECKNGNWIRKSQLSETATCEGNGFWKPGPYAPVCEEIRCLLPNVRHLKIQPRVQWYRFQDSVKFSCDDGYKLAGNNQARCTETGWSSIPTCKEITCPIPTVPHLKIQPRANAQWYRFQDSVKFSCDDGYKLEGNNQARCTETGWSSIPPRCKGTEICNSDVENGFVVKKESNLYYACNNGYKLPHGHWWDEVECKEGVLTGLKPCIEKSRCHTPEIPHAISKVEQDGFNGIVKIQCQEGYTPEEFSLECKDGIWETPPHNCTQTTCNVPLKVENAVVLKAFQSEYADGSTVEFACRKSYELIGNKIIECTRGKWNYSPTCEKKTEPTENPGTPATDPGSKIQQIDPQNEQ